MKLVCMLEVMINRTSVLDTNCSPEAFIRIFFVIKVMD
jgi:hypothetical protein